ncbi:MAG: ADP-ribosylglycohydrolase family protein [Planctomycetota bacterium]
MTDRAILGCLIGTAVGDALGLPYEGISPRRAVKMLGPPSRFRFLFGRGMVSDDTEHTVLVAESLIESGGEAALLERAFARRLKRWFLLLPAGLGLATAKACCKLMIGISPKNSGVFSAGNGPAMRAAILGVFADSVDQVSELVRITTRITHTDPKAEMGAFAIALAAYCAKSGEPMGPHEYLSRLRVGLRCDGSTDFLALIQRAIESLQNNCATEQFATELGLSKGVSGYVYHCVPVVIHCWLSHQDSFQAAMHSIISCGGDTDTNGAMVGGILGAKGGPDSIPPEFLRRLVLCPFSMKSLQALSSQLRNTIESGRQCQPVSPHWSFVLPRNLFFLFVVLLHGFRRLIPPY